LKNLPPRAREDTSTADLPPYPGTPRWVYVFGLIVIVPVAVFVIRHLTGAGLGHHIP
jgi:hypothetical protein